MILLVRTRANSSLIVTVDSGLIQVLFARYHEKVRGPEVTLRIERYFPWFDVIWERDVSVNKNSVSIRARDMLIVTELKLRKERFSWIHFEHLMPNDSSSLNEGGIHYSLSLFQETLFLPHLLLSFGIKCSKWIHEKRSFLNFIYRSKCECFLVAGLSRL